MYFADFETTTEAISKDKSWVWLWGVKGANTGDIMHWGIDIAEFFETLKNEKMSVVYFHNLGFDGNYIYKWLLANGYDFKNSDEELDDNEWNWICDERGVLYSITLNYKGFTVRFLDSWKVLMASVEKLGSAIGLEKLEIDYHKFGGYKSKADVDKEAIKYLERDIDVVIKTFSKVIKIYDKKITRASMAYEDFVKWYNDENGSGRQFAMDFGGWVWNYREKQKEFMNVLSKDEWMYINKSYQGGYVNWNEEYTNKELWTPEGVSYDVNSLYPSVMLNNKIPYGRMLYSKPFDGDYASLVTVMIQHAKIKNDDWPPIIRQHGGKYSEAKYLKEVTYTEYTYWEDELEFIKSKYDMQYVEIKRVYFKTKYVFKTWLEEKKGLKINAKDPVERDFHKGIYNSNYGKFAQNIFMGQRIIVRDGNHVEKDKWGNKLLVDIEGNVVRHLASNAVRYGANGEFKHDSSFTESENRKHIAVASKVTSDARLVLFKAMFENIDIWLYSDTDSCYFTEEPKNIWIHDSEFGAWKKEHNFNKFKVLRAKCYMLEDIHGKIIRKISGLSDVGKAKVTWDNFYIGSVIEGGKRGAKNVDGGKLIINTDFKLGEDAFKA